MTQNILSSIDDTEFSYSLSDDFMKEKPGYKEGYNPVNEDIHDATYTDNLYYPRKGRAGDQSEESCYQLGYWLASLSAQRYSDVPRVIYSGTISNGGVKWTNPACATRPVISILKSEFKEATGIDVDE